MASYTSIPGSPVGAFKHDLREREVYRNEDIDRSKSYLNYTLSGHGTTTRECMNYYDLLLKNVYHRAGSTVTAGEWTVQMPADLEPEKEEAFFKCAYDFLNHYYFDGDTSRCILAEVHKDEIGQPHLHYVFTFPEVDNEKYVNPQEKFVAGIQAAVKKYEDIPHDRETIRDCYSALKRYEQRSDNQRERDTIREIGRLFGLQRDDARWIFTRIRRLNSQIYEKRLMSKDEFLTKKSFWNFHPAFQKWVDDHGFDCTVFKGGGGISLTVEQLKDITRRTGKTLDRGLSVDYISGLINENTQLHERVAELEKQTALRRIHGWSRSEEIVR